MNQTCLICGPDVDCAGHPAKKMRPRPLAHETATVGVCPICEHMHTETDNAKHSLGGLYQIKRALVFGPVFCLSRKGIKKDDLPYQAVVHGTRIRDGALQLDTLEGWTEDFEGVWAICSPEPYKDAGL